MLVEVQVGTARCRAAPAWGHRSPCEGSLRTADTPRAPAQVRACEVLPLSA